MIVNEVSRRYANALYEIAKGKKNSDLILSELRVIDSVISNDKSIAEYIKSPVVPPDQKKKVISNTFKGKVSDDVLSFLELLADKNRLSFFAEIAKAFESIIDEDHGVTRGHVRSAVALSPEERKNIEETVNRVTKKKVILTFAEDPKLLGGLVAQVGGWTFDDSLESHLTRLGEDLNRRTN